MTAKRDQYAFLSEPSGPPNVSVITQYAEFSLHSQVLERSSKWFAASMSEIWCKDGKPAGMSRYQYILDIDDERFSALNPVHTRVDGTTNITPSAPDDMQELFIKEICESYIWLFKCFYGEPINLQSTNKAALLVSLADQYDALDCVADRVRADFFEWQHLDTEIMKSPRIFLNLGYKMKSQRIFRDAFINIVGMCYGRDIGDFEFDPELAYSYQAIAEPILSLVESAVVKLEQLVAGAMSRFLALNQFGEHTYQVRTLVRNGLGRCFDKYTELGLGSEGELFRMIVNDSFQPQSSEFNDLDKDQLKSLQQQAVRLISKVKGVARVLTENNLRCQRCPAWLTCTDIADEELPWAK